MCPLCLTTVALVSAGATSTGALTAFTMRKRRKRNHTSENNSTPSTRNKYLNKEEVNNADIT